MHPALQKTWRSQASPSSSSGTGAWGPSEQVLLGFAISPEAPCRATQTAEMMILQNTAPMRLGPFPPQPVPKPFADIPIEIGKYAPGSGAVAVVIRPSAQDGISRRGMCNRYRGYGLFWRIIAKPFSNRVR
jgi:hypothetical protein